MKWIKQIKYIKSGWFANKSIKTVVRLCVDGSAFPPLIFARRLHAIEPQPQPQTPCSETISGPRQEGQK